MPLAGSVPCADLGTEHCPCELAFSGACVYCTLPRTGGACACRWAGACVMLQMEKGMQGAKAGVAAPARRQRYAVVRSTAEVARGVREVWLQAEVNSGAAFRRPGAFLMVRPAARPVRYDVPLTVVGTRGREVRLVYKVAGPKTQALAGLRPGEGAVWRGPYYNGLMGGHRLTRAAVECAVVVARGLGQAAAIPVTGWLRSRGTRVEVLIDPRGAGGTFAAAELAAAAAAPVRVLNCYRHSGLAAIGNALGRSAAGGTGPAPAAGDAGAVSTPGRSLPRGIALVVSCGSDLQHRWIAEAWPQLRDAAGAMRPEMVASNNSPVVCGEGACGACVRRLPGGGRVRGCKADLPPECVWPTRETGSVRGRRVGEGGRNV